MFLNILKLESQFIVLIFKNLNAAFHSDRTLFTEFIFPDPVYIELSVNLSKYQHLNKAFQVVLPQRFHYQNNIIINIHKLTHC